MVGAEGPEETHLLRDDGNLLGLIAERQVAQLVALVKHMVPDGHVDENRQHNAGPDGQVVGEDSQLVVRVANPAPQLEGRVSAESWAEGGTTERGDQAPTVALPYMRCPFGA